MTLAHNLIVVGAQVDTGRLYDNEDPGYELFLVALSERVDESMKAAQRRAEREAGG